MERFLSHKHKYNIIDYNYLSMMDGGGTICQNCSAFITNMVTVACSDGHEYVIGVDCAKTLSSIGERDLKKVNTSIGRLKKFYKKISELTKQGYDIKIILDEDRYLLHTYHTTDYFGKSLGKPFLKYQGYSIPVIKAHMPIIKEHLEI